LVYKGSFIENNYEGKGVLYINNKKIYEGEFKNNLYNGYGVLYNEK